MSEANNIICGEATTSLSNLRTQMNDVVLRANEVLRNEVLASLEMMLRFAQTDTPTA